MRYGSLLVAGLVLALASGKANAAVEWFDNLSNGGGGYSYGVASYSDNGNGPLAQSFDTGSGPIYGPLEVQLDVTAFTSDAGSVVITLNSDVGNSPGNVVATLGTFTDAELASLPGMLDISDISAPLDASTRYWVVLTDGNTDGTPSSIAWDSATDSTGLGTAGQYTQLDPGGDTDPGSLTYADDQFDVNDPTTVAPFTMMVEDAPEPASLAILGFGLVGLATARKRRKRPSLSPNPAR